MIRFKPFVLSMSLVFAAAAGFVSPRPASAGDAFWYGGDVTKYLTPQQQTTLNQCLMQAVPQIQRGIMFSTFFGKPLDPHPANFIYDPARTWDGYTLLSSLSGYTDATTGKSYTTILIDMNGNIVNQWEWPIYSFPAKMLPNGDLITGEGNFSELFGIPKLVQIDWCGKKVWEWDGSKAPPWYDKNNQPQHSGWHHDFEREGSPVGYYAPGQLAKTRGGKTLILADWIPPLSTTCPDPTDSSKCISKFRLYDNVIYEVDWDGNVVFEWHTWDHFDQMGFDAAAKDGILNVKAGAGNSENATDYQHLNEASYLGPNEWYRRGDERFHPDNILFDGRESNIVGIIARYADRNGKWKAGDIVWRIGPDYAAGPEHKLDQVIGQHMAHMIPQGLPGAGNILLFDNGGGSGFGSLIRGLRPGTNPNTLRPYSRVIEFNPVTLDLVWEYRAHGDQLPLFSFFISGAQRLQNGNTLITEGANGRVFEVTREGEIVWQYVAPFKGGPGSLGGFLGSNSVYRAYRIPSWWVPNKACQ